MKHQKTIRSLMITQYGSSITKSMVVKNILEHLQNMGLYDRFIDSVLAILFFIFLRWVLVRIFLQFSHDKQKEFLWRKAATYCSVFFLVFLLSIIWLRGFHSVSTYFGLLSAGLAVALKDPLTNLAGWLFILVRKPFEAGDRVQIGNYAGDVIDIDIFQFTLMESSISGVSKDMRTGRLIKISNSTVFTEPQVNFTKGWFEYIWNTIEVNITFESNWKKARTILEEIVNAEGEDTTRRAKVTMSAASEKYMVLNMPLEPVVLTGVYDNGVMLTAAYLCDPRVRRRSSSKVWEQLLERFSGEDDIVFAYPTQRSFSNVTEGKPAIRAETARTLQKKATKKSLHQTGTPLFESKPS
ncbi:MAG: mechanosensitive ion channel protein MscS [Syntrophus sp. (in: bacteria)]|nr:mechanosensitive ion channel protein MscS [Syntrophus sp. (in: bacteria)]